MKLIRDRRKAMHLSQGRAAQMVPPRPISDTRWRQLEDGYRTIKGVGRVPEAAPSLTLAGMAYVVGVTPAELHAEGCHDAAEQLVALTAARAREDGDVQAEAARAARTVGGLNVRQRQALEREIAEGLRRIRAEQGR